jgi:hypothetical protein
MPNRSLPQLTHAVASHTRWAHVLGSYGSPFTAQLLLLPPSRFDALQLGRAWNAGRHAPDVTLALEFDAPVTTLRMCPRMAPTEGVVGLVVVVFASSLEEADDEATTTTTTTTALRIAHRELWRDGEWVAVALPAPARALRIEFVESPSWIALYAVEGSF